MTAGIDVDPATKRRRDTLLGGLPKTGVLAAAGLGTAMVALLASPAFADKTMDVQMLQTAASIENLAVATYDTALTLDFIGGASCERRREGVRREDQGAARAARRGVQRRGDPPGRQGAGPARPGAARRGEQRQAVAHRSRGRSSTSPSSSRTAPRRRTWPTPGTYSNKNARSVVASIMGVEAQHVAILNAVKALARRRVPPT